MICARNKHSTRSTLFGGVISVAIVVVLGADGARGQTPEFGTLGSAPLGDPSGLNPALGAGSVLPLEFPAARGGLPIPIAVGNTGSHAVGLAGVGWSLPLLTVRRSDTLSQRKPVHLGMAADPLPEAAERLFLNVGTGPMLMAKTAPDSYRPFAAEQFIELVESPGGWTALMPDGTAYSYSALPGSEFEDEWFLTRIADASENNLLLLHYDTFNVPAPRPADPGAGMTLKEVVLTRVEYSMAPSSCPKHTVEMQYCQWNSTLGECQASGSDPEYLDVSFVNGRARVRTRLISSLTVWSQATSDCSPASRASLRKYALGYSPDQDTGQPRLTAVDLFGLDDDGSDPATSLPLARYAYGSVFDSDILQFGNERVVDLPPGADFAADSLALTAVRPELPFISGTGTLQQLVDVNGDGRVDYVYPTDDPEKSRISGNVPDSSGDDSSTFDGVAEYDVGDGALTKLGDSVLPLYAHTTPRTNVTSSFDEMVDWNGDGRLDMIYADQGQDALGNPSTDHWRILINTPGPSGRPEDIVWKETHLDVSFLKAEILKSNWLHPELPAETDFPLAVSRSRDAGVLTGTFPDQSFLERSTVTEWELKDVNADGFPDFVFNSLPVRNRAVLGPDGVLHFDAVDVDSGNELMVVYHTGLLMAGAGDSPSTWAGPAVVRRRAGCCGVARFSASGVAEADGTIPGSEHMVCGSVEANGDGIVDYVVEEPEPDTGVKTRIAIRSSGLPQVVDEDLPENTLGNYTQNERKRAIEVPGPVNVVQTTPRAPCSELSPDAVKGRNQQSALRDITGDGIPDYVYFGTLKHVGQFSFGHELQYPGVETADDVEPGWWVMSGTGVGYLPPRPILSPVPFALLTTLTTCPPGDGLSRTVAQLVDLNGDGRPEIVRSDGPNRLRVASLLSSTGAAGAHSSGLLVRVDNGYGGVSKISYASAKKDHRTPHAVPFPEIVIAETESVSGKGLSQSFAPVRFAYGDASRFYHPLLARWVFSGYGRRVVLAGLPTEEGEEGSLHGRATIADALRFETLPSGYDAYTLAGRIRDQTVLTGLLDGDPWKLLTVNVDSDPAVSGNMHQEYDSSRGIPFVESVGDLIATECYDLQPFGPPPGIGSLELCRDTGVSYVQDHSAWEGDSAYPSPGSIATRMTVLAADDFGNPLRVKFENDRATPEDDTCAEYSYATPAGSANRIVSAAYTWRLGNCFQEETYAAVRHLYDEETGVVEGQVGAGRYSGSILERYLDGTKLEEYRTSFYTHDEFGNAVTFKRQREDGTAALSSYRYDEFGLVRERDAVVTTDGISLGTDIGYDPHLLLPTSSTDPNGVVLGAQYDRFGRATLTSVLDPETGAEFALRAIAYEGDDGTAPQGRRLRIFRFDKDVPKSDAADGGPTGASRAHTIFADEWNRLRYKEFELGDHTDYAGNTLVGDFTLYDGLGRPVFRANPFPGSEIDAEKYGATYTYNDDGRLQCKVLGQGLQLSTFTHEPSERFAKCRDYSYAGNKLVVRTTGPNERNLLDDDFGIFDELALSAVGRPLWKSRRRATDRFEFTQFEHDRLGRLVAVHRDQDPTTLDGEIVTWTATVDSLGHVTSLSEPGVATMNHDYDRWGNRLSTTWTDSTATPTVERSVVNRYDGLGRLIAVDEQTDGELDLGRRVEYFYDVAAGDPNHVNPSNLAGRLSYTSGAVSSAYLGYDLLGRPVSETHVFGDNNVAATTVRELALSGRPQSLAFLIPDTGSSLETAQYEYDSAGRMRKVMWNDGIESPTTLWEAAVIDLFGRPREIRLGNGVIQGFAYKASARREIEAFDTRKDGVGRLTTYGQFDGLMRLRDRTVIDDTFSPNVFETTNYEYDELNRVSRVQTMPLLGTPVEDDEFVYDGLGNMRQVVDHIGTNDLVLTTHPADRDRLCRTDETPPSAPFVCTYQYDALGNVARIGFDPSTEQRFQYDGQSRVVHMQRGAATSSIDYGSFGSPAQRTIHGVGIGKDRRTRYFGSLIQQTTFVASDGTPIALDDGAGLPFSTYFERRIAGPRGVVALVRRTDADEAVILYPHANAATVPLVTRADGTPVRRQAHRAFGQIRAEANGAPAREKTLFDWNSGEDLGHFGVSHIGARLYDTETGRFLQRDPNITLRSTSRMNPYAFAFNDPINFTDRNGLDGKQNEEVVDGELWFTPSGAISTPLHWPETVDNTPAQSGTPGWQQQTERTGARGPSRPPGGPTDDIGVQSFLFGEGGRWLGITTTGLGLSAARYEARHLAHVNKYQYLTELGISIPQEEAPSAAARAGGNRWVSLGGNFLLVAGTVLDVDLYIESVRTGDIEGIWIASAGLATDGAAIAYAFGYAAAGPWALAGSIGIGLYYVATDEDARAAVAGTFVGLAKGIVDPVGTVELVQGVVGPSPATILSGQVGEAVGDFTIGVLAPVVERDELLP